MKLQLTTNSPGRTKYSYYNNDARLRKHIRRMFAEDVYDSIIELVDTGNEGDSITVVNRSGFDIEVSLVA